MGVPYEYNLIVRVFPVTDIASPSGQKAMTTPMAKFVKSKLPEALTGSGWEINSHSLAFYKDKVVLSVLLQRN